MSLVRFRMSGLVQNESVQNESGSVQNEWFGSE